MNKYVVMVYGVNKWVVVPIGPFDTYDEACDYLNYLFKTMPGDFKVHGVDVDHVRVIECLTPSKQELGE
jgi:hypothetical protein